MAATPTISIGLASRQQGDRVADVVAEADVGVAHGRFVVGDGKASFDHVGRRADAVAVGAEFVADDRRVECLAVVVAARQGGERALPDATDLSGPWSVADLLLHRRGDHAALDHPLAVDAVDEHGCALLADRTDEAGDQPVLQRLLEQDEEHQERDGRDEQREAHLGTGHFLEREKHEWGNLVAGR